MAKQDAYFQFPIAMLKGATSTEVVTQQIVRYSIWHNALDIRDKHADKVAGMAAEYKANHPGTQYTKGDYEQELVMAAANRLNVTCGAIENTLFEGIKLREHYGTRGVQCRMRDDYLWSAHNESWSLIRFRVLCAVLAGIGDREAVKVSTKRIRTLGAGYDSSKNVHEKNLLSQGAVNYWLDELWYQNLFQFCKFGKYRWYSIRKPSDEELAKAVKVISQRRQKKVAIDAKLI
jgi:hypothetical protein